jgi:hypothetical protein
MVDSRSTFVEFEALIARMRALVANISESLPSNMRKLLDELRAGGFSADQIAALAKEAAWNISGDEASGANIAIAVRAYLAGRRG